MLSRVSSTLRSKVTLCSRNLSTGVTPLVAIERPSEGVAHLILQRHEGKNAFSADMIKEFNTAVSTLAAAKDINCVVVRSGVERVFCAGADLKERLVMPEDAVAPFVATLRAAFDGVAQLPMPTIAAIDGVALGGGLELALACDIRIVSSNPKNLLGLPETALAIIPGAGGTQRLPRVVGVAKAKELIYTAARLSPQQALSIGLVNEVAPEGVTAATRAAEMAVQIANKGPIALRMAKQSIDAGLALPLKDALEEENRGYIGVTYTSDRVEGLKAFVEKRSPSYRGV